MTVVFDCNYICWVCAYALSHGMEYRGGRTEIIFGFLKQITYLLEHYEATQAIFCWDSKRSKRRDLYPEYKATRHQNEEKQPATEIIFYQFEQIRQELVPWLGFLNSFLITGYESDDIIAQVVIKSELEKPIIVISSDNDLLQLLDHCSIYSITKKQTASIETFTREYGIPPKQWAEVKAIAGCSSDNVKGVVGIGEKKALLYLLGKMKKGANLLSIENSRDIIERNRTLVTLPFPGIPTPKIRPNTLGISSFQEACYAYGFESLLNERAISRWSSIAKKLNGSGLHGSER